jgi:hypothetical protein
MKNSAAVYNAMTIARIATDRSLREDPPRETKSAVAISYYDAFGETYATLPPLFFHRVIAIS